MLVWFSSERAELKFCFRPLGRPDCCVAVPYAQLPKRGVFLYFSEIKCQTRCQIRQMRFLFMHETYCSVSRCAATHQTTAASLNPPMLSLLTLCSDSRFHSGINLFVENLVLIRSHVLFFCSPEFSPLVPSVWHSLVRHVLCRERPSLFWTFSLDHLVCTSIWGIKYQVREAFHQSCCGFGQPTSWWLASVSFWAVYTLGFPNRELKLPATDAALGPLLSLLYTSTAWHPRLIQIQYACILPLGGPTSAGRPSNLRLHQEVIRWLHAFPSPFIELTVVNFRYDIHASPYLDPDAFPPTLTHLLVSFI